MGKNRRSATTCWIRGIKHNSVHFLNIWATKVPRGLNLMHKMTRMGLAFKTEGEDMLNRTVTGDGPSEDMLNRTVTGDGPSEDMLNRTVTGDGPSEDMLNRTVTGDGPSRIHAQQDCYR
jgi:hypothetical protein